MQLEFDVCTASEIPLSADFNDRVKLSYKIFRLKPMGSRFKINLFKYLYFWIDKEIFNNSLLEIHVKTSLFQIICKEIQYLYNKQISLSVLSKFVGPVGQSDIFYECPTKNVRAPNQMSDRKYKYTNFVDEKKRNTSAHKGQQWGFMSSCCFCRHWHNTLNFR